MTNRAKLHYLFVEANKKRLEIANICDYLKFKKDMSYVEWQAMHRCIDMLQEQISANDEEIRRELKKERES